VRTIHKVLPEYLKYLETLDRSTATLRGYRYDILYFDSFLSELHGPDVQLNAVSSSDLNGYRSVLIEEKKLKPASVNRKIVLLRKFFEWAVAKGIIGSNPASGLRLIRMRGGKKTEFLRSREIHALLRSAGMSSHGLGRRNYAIIKLMLETGLRIQEIIELTVKDVSLYDRSGFLLKRIPGRKSPITRSLSRELRTSISDYLASCRLTDSRERLFTGTRRTPLSPRGVLKIIRTVADRAKIPDRKVTAETLRNTFIINELRSDPECASDLAEFLGYASAVPLTPYFTVAREEAR
jgi:site-specific recombinase XerD